MQPERKKGQYVPPKRQRPDPSLAGEGPNKRLKNSGDAPSGADDVPKIPRSENPLVQSNCLTTPGVIVDPIV